MVDDEAIYRENRAAFAADAGKLATEFFWEKWEAEMGRLHPSEIVEAAFRWLLTEKGAKL